MVQLQADGGFQPFLGQLIGSTVSWTSGLESGTATVSDCRLAGFDQAGMATFEIFLAVQGD
jgi:hypothetical protein